MKFSFCGFIQLVFHINQLLFRFSFIEILKDFRCCQSVCLSLSDHSRHAFHVFRFNVISFPTKFYEYFCGDSICNQDVLVFWSLLKCCRFGLPIPLIISFNNILIANHVITNRKVKQNNNKSMGFFSSSFLSLSFRFARAFRVRLHKHQFLLQ